MSILDEIFARKREEVEEAQRSIPEAVLMESCGAAPLTRGFRKALTQRSTPLALIAEIKKASPSQGVIRGDFDAAEISKTYQRAGAHCLSVLTDVQYFQGSPANLVSVREASTLPILRKDFIYHPYQVYEARSWGADAILLIVAGLSKDQLVELAGTARSVELDVLVEVHDEHEAQIALDAKADLIGINNRDLRTFKTSMATTERLAPMLLRHATVVSESAISNHADVEKLIEWGADAALIGTTFCAAPDIEAKVREVMGW